MYAHTINKMNNEGVCFSNELLVKSCGKPSRRVINDFSLHIPLDKVYIIVYTIVRGGFNANSKIICQRQQSGCTAS